MAAPSPSLPVLPPGCQLLHEDVFHSPDRESLDEDSRKRRDPTMLHSGDILIPPIADKNQKYTLVFDLDETLIYGRDGCLIGRAYLGNLLNFLDPANFEIIVWTAGEKEYAKNVLEAINSDNKIQHLVYRHSTWLVDDSYTKDLKKLGRDLNSTLIIENTPDCIRNNPQNGIIVQDFKIDRLEHAQGPDSPLVDQTLLHLKAVLQELLQSGKSVPDFLEECKSLEKKTVPSINGDISVYYLRSSSVRRKRRRNEGV